MRCSICLEGQTHPFNLDCAHSFCFKCIDDWAQIAPAAKCPLCRTPFSQPVPRRGERITRSMTHRRRRRNCMCSLRHHIDRWVQIKNNAGSPVYLFVLFHRIMQLIYNNQLLFLADKARSSLFSRALKEKLDQFEGDGYLEARIWKYKLRDLLDV